jgi:hypothetical protein
MESFGSRMAHEATTGVVRAESREVGMAQVNYNQPSEPRGNGDGNAGIYAILVIIVVLIIGAVLYFSGVLGPRAAEDDDINADIDIEQPEVPDVDVPSDVEIDVPDIDVPDTVTVVD